MDMRSWMESRFRCSCDYKPSQNIDRENLKTSWEKSISLLRAELVKCLSPLHGSHHVAINILEQNPSSNHRNEKHYTNYYGRLPGTPKGHILSNRNTTDALHASNATSERTCNRGYY
ncbi:hypothetical protein WUBG_08152 [Wuchereria bancrofti]|uniref:Uncharacterized protein n=1 Tax=Wuchereria bancrofti TaxID=6293 RepID=J9EFJ4_WUCBA|nr:hypothetical protein WUBG_08152 [Wuchereria bancrofti]